MKIDKLKLWEIKLLIIINNNIYKSNEIDEQLYIGVGRVRRYACCPYCFFDYYE